MDKTLPLDRYEDLSHRIFVVKGDRGYGTGFILDGKYLVSCAHVVDKEEVAFFQYDKSAIAQEYYKAYRRIDWISPEEQYDITVLPINQDVINVDNILKLAPESYSVQREDECTVIGFSSYVLGATPQITDIKVANLIKNKYGILDAQLDKTLIAGNSGGPVLNSKNEVVGIVRTGAPNMRSEGNFGSTFLPVQQFRDFLAFVNRSIEDELASQSIGEK